MAKLRVVVMASGGGTNLQILLDRFPAGERSAEAAEVALVVANRACGALERAAAAGVRGELVDPDNFASLEDLGTHLLDLYRQEGIGLVVLAGYLKMIPDNLVRAFRHRMVNIHPALLPSFGGKGMYGRRVHEAVLASGAKLSGPTVHFVDEEYDRGPIIAQRAVPVYHGDSPESLAGRVLEEEHRILPEVVDLIARGRVKVVDGIVQVS
ncbi:MAG TPA: phosphoribosylglycinamide formyltransferase [Candidatus Glassbacteria bacterium]|nr:phosphoribosylglycinamide formyltransferase [Candidatus Glassbacteria bacterium]